MKCPSGNAVAAGGRIAKRFGPAVRPYQCDKCEWWHLTTTVYRHHTESLEERTRPIFKGLER